jgi:hypothetical protein
MARRWRRLAAATTFWPFLAAAPSVQSERTDRPPRMGGVCNTGYSLESSRTHLSALQRVLSSVDVAALGEWTWVLVQSEDWRQILLKVGRDPDSPAFTILEKRQTFLEEALFVPMAERSATLLAKFRLPLDLLLEHAVLHELGHAICEEVDEGRTLEYARQLRRSGVVTCADAGPPDARRLGWPQGHSQGQASPPPSHDARGEALAVPARIRDAQALLEQALELLPAEHRPTRPAVLVMQHASPKLLKLTEGTCAAVLGSKEVQPTIFVRWDCPLLEKAQQQGAIYLRALAAVLAHESSHVRGLNEVEARELELKVFTGLVTKLSGTEWQIAQEYRGILVRRLQIQRSRQ